MFVSSLMSVKPQNGLLQWDVHELAKALVSGEGTCIYELEILQLIAVDLEPQNCQWRLERPTNVNNFPIVLRGLFH